MTNNFLLVSLNEKKARNLAGVIKNPSCRKILDYLAKKESSTETEISKTTGVPLSTVHYSLKQLVEAKLVKSDEYHYSSKGKEVSHYKLANKYVIIAPEESKKDLREQLKRILPVAAIIGVFGLVAAWFGNSVGRFAATAEMASIQKAAPMMAEKASMVLEEGADQIAQQTVQQVGPVIQQTSWLPYFLWFIAGAVVGIGLYLLIDYLIKRFSK